MEISEHGLKGETVTLTSDDSLSDVPESHQHLLDADIRSVFDDPLGYFWVTAARTPFPSMARWLQQAVECGTWTLDLITSEYTGDGAVFWLDAEPFKPAGIWLPEDSDLSELPPDLREFFQLIGGIDWTGYGVTGGIGSVSLPLQRGSVRSQIKDDIYGEDLNADDAFFLGQSIDGVSLFSPSIIGEAGSAFTPTRQNFSEQLLQQSTGFSINSVEVSTRYGMAMAGILIDPGSDRHHGRLMAQFAVAGVSSSEVHWGQRVALMSMTERQ